MRDIQNKGTLSHALNAHQAVFGEFFITLVEAGEKSGALELTLKKLADQQEKDSENASKLKGALIYPAIVIVVFICAVTAILILAVPTIQETFSSRGQELPLATQFLVKTSELIKQYWWLLIISIAGGFAGLSWWLKTTISGRSVSDHAKLRLPVFKSLFIRLYMHRFCSITSLMLLSGVLLAETLETVARNINNTQIEAAIMRTRLAVIQGKQVSASLKNEPLIPVDVVNMIETGESSGQIGQMLERLGKIYGKQVDGAIKNLLTVLTPALTVVIGLAVLFIFIAVFGPILSLVQNAPDPSNL